MSKDPRDEVLDRLESALSELRSVTAATGTTSASGLDRETAFTNLENAQAMVDNIAASTVLTEEQRAEFKRLASGATTDRLRSLARGVEPDARTINIVVSGTGTISVD